MQGSIRYSGRTLNSGPLLVDNDRVRTLAVTLAITFVVGSAVAALYMVFAAWFPYENLSSDELQKDDWLAPVAPVVLLLAVATLVLVVKHRPLWAAVSFVAQAVVGLLVLRFALRELSDRSDDELIAFALSIGFVGLCAVIASFGQRTNT